MKSATAPRIASGFISGWPEAPGSPLHLSLCVPTEPVIAGISHANAPVWADRLRALVRDRFQVAELIQTEIGPVVGANVGPGVVGVCVFQPTEEELGWVSA